MYKLFKHVDYRALHSFYDANINRVDVIHLFNGVSFSSRPWVSTFETTLPRNHNHRTFINDYLMSRIASTSCKQIIAFSKSTYAIQERYLKLHYPQYYNKISAKMTIIHPPQKLLIESYSEKVLDNSIVHFLLVGNDIFSKGGLESVRVITQLHNEGYRVKLSIVSIFQLDNITKKSLEDIENLKKEISQNSKSIELLGYIPYKEVLKLMKDVDLVLLPTIADTYGYSVLEAQASGTPVISTDIRALPEINDDVCGWIINIPKDVNGNSICKSEDERVILSDTIQKELYRIIKDDILPHRETIKEKGIKSLQRIERCHNPKTVAQRLEEIYVNALQA